MAVNESSSVPARLKDLKDSVKERFLGLLGIRQPKVLLEDEQEVFLQVGRTVWHAPRQLRIELWLSSLARRHSLVSGYQEYLSKDITREAANDIEKDVQRTFPNTRRFHAEEGQTQLRNVLRAYAAYDPEVAYCQGMNFLTGLLLMYMPTEAHSFAALVVLMEDRKLRSFYHRSMSLLQVQLWQLSRLISPSLNQHLEALGVVPMLYGASWLMTAFSADFPLPFSARIMDVLLADQCECALLKVAAAIMKAVEQRLHAMSDLEEVLGYLKLDVPAWEEPELHDLLAAAFTKPWTPRQLSILRSTEGAETVAQAMDRVMNMHEQLSAQTCEDEEGGEDGGSAGGGGGGDGEARVGLTVPRLQPPPQPSSSFTASPACGTPVNGGAHGTGSHGGAASVSPTAPAAGSAAAAAAAAAAADVKYSGGGATPSILDGVTSGGSGNTTCRKGALILLQGGASANSSPAAWAIPCIHPNVPASPALQAFRRAHMTCFQAAVTAEARYGGAISSNTSQPRSHGSYALLNGSSGGLEDSALAATVAAGDVESDGSPHRSYPDLHRGSDGCSPEEWGDFSAAAVRQQWRSIVRAAPGSTRHVLMSAEDLSGSAAAAGADGGPWRGTASAFSSYGGTLAAPPTPSSRESSSGSATQPIPVPAGRGGVHSNAATVGSAFAAAASAAAAACSSTVTAAIGKPPLPPRCVSLDRGGPVSGGLYSRLSVVAEDPLALQMGAVAPAPSPRGSIDLHLLGRAGSQQLEAYEQQGHLLCGTGFGAVGGSSGSSTAAVNGGGGGASCSGDCVSGVASAATGGPVLSPSAISGAVSPHGMSSPRVLAGWCTSGPAGGATSTSGATGSNTPTTGYLPLGFERAMSGSLLDVNYGCNIGGGAGLSSLPERSYSMVSPLPTVAALEAAVMPLIPSHPRPAGASSAAQLTSGEHCALVSLGHSLATSQGTTHQCLEQEKQQSDMATDIAGDILRMLSAVDTGNANAAYDPGVILGESMYADSPNKEEHKLVRTGSEHLRHMPSLSALADIAAQDLAKAQEEAERVRLELEAQLQLQRASERISWSTSTAEPMTLGSISVSATISCGRQTGGGAGPLTEVQLAEAMAEAGATAATAVAVSSALESAAERVGTSSSGGGSSGTASAVSAAVTSTEAASGSGTQSMGVSSGAAGSGGVGGVVFRRPTLYVDGIPMFDPKSLMADNHEAQVMFTPTVSPGASSYADPVLSGFTPTGDSTTPGERDAAGDGDGTAASGGGGGSSSSGADVSATTFDKSDVVHDAVGSSESGAEEAESVPSVSAVVAEAAPGRASSAPPECLSTPPPSGTDLAETERLAAQSGASAGGSGDGCDAGAEAEDQLVMPAAAASRTVEAEAAAVNGTTVQEELSTLPSASEWVDWSQAPPILAAPSAGIPFSQLPSVSASVSAAQSLNASPHCPETKALSLVDGLPSPVSLSLLQPMGKIMAGLDHDLIDMASPARPLTLPISSKQPRQWSPGAGAAAGSDEVAVASSCCATGTGLSPGAPAVPPVVAALQPDSVRPPGGSFSDLAAAGGNSCQTACTSSFSQQPPSPYGLLPTTSSVTHVAPMAPAISFASSTAGGGGGSFAGGGAMTTVWSSSVGVVVRSDVNLTHPPSDSMDVNMRIHSHGAVVACASSDESDRCADDDDDFGDVGDADGRSNSILGVGAARSATPGSPEACMSPKRKLLASLHDAASEGSLQGEPGAADSNKFCGDSCVARALPHVMAEIMLPESSTQDPDCSFAWDSPSSNLPVSGGGVAATAAAAEDTEAACDEYSLRLQLQLQPESAMGHRQSEVTGTDGKLTKGNLAPVTGGVGFSGVASGRGSWSGALGPLELGDGVVPDCSGAASRGSVIEQQVSLEMDMEGEEVDNSPFRAVLSPSLAHHIMSAYLRSEQHQMQQEQKELEERMAREQERLALEQQQVQLAPERQQQQQLSGSTAAPATAPVLLATSAGLEFLPEAVAAVGSAFETVATSAAVAPATAATMMPIIHSGPPIVTASTCVGAAGILGEQIVPNMPMRTAASGVVSPVLCSPGRPSAVYNGAYRIASAPQQPYLMQQTTISAAAAAAKVMTPFALSSGDPSSSRLTAELQQVIPPPLQPVLLQPDAPSPPPVPNISGSVADGVRSHASGRTSLRCTGSGDGDGISGMTSSGGAAAAPGHGAGSIGSERISASGAPPPVSLPAYGASESCTTASSAMGLPGATADVATSMTMGAASQQPPMGHVSCTRIGSSGGAIMQLLPPPPPPQVPLCTVRHEPASVPTAPPSLQMPLPLPPVLCSSSATVTAVAEGEGGGGVAACTPVANIASGCAAMTSALPQPPPPIWTATFDGIDNTPKADVVATGTEDGNGSNGPEPRTLSSAFSAEADTPPQEFAREGSGCDGCHGAPATTTGSSSFGAQEYVLNVGKGMAIDAAATAMVGVSQVQQQQQGQGQGKEEPRHQPLSPGRPWDVI
ncbi:hypothetical protein VaNZ11_006787 [Volvox africanus]|uniref:Rab-GAP TBC domain-containing protein n=1 Tax=Volvox africanus TaxID=51714 RepID=A0ABQ5S362_9CHLO|nr:hypothetical protein VaNZ11_006787 [Volvox africanus]